MTEETMQFITTFAARKRTKRLFRNLMLLLPFVVVVFVDFFVLPSHQQTRRILVDDRHANVSRRMQCSEPKATAVITTYLPERHANLETQVNTLLDCCFIDQIIIWNNNPSFHLQVNHHSVHVRNGIVNIGTDAKYRGCMAGKFFACYLIDDDWLPIHVKTLYRVFLANQGETPVVITDGVTQYMDVSMTYTDDNSVHFGFAWLGVGSFILKRDAELFIRQHHLIPRKYWKHSDIFFFIFANKFPIVLSAELTPILANDSVEKMSGAENYEIFLKQAHRHAFDTVLDHHSQFVNSWEDSRQDDLKAVCANSDLILDNGFNLISRESHSSTTSENFVKVDGGEQLNAMKYPYYALCDNHKTSAYAPMGPLARGRYFGFLFDKVRLLDAIEITFSAQQVHFEFSPFDLEIRDVKGTWNLAPVISRLRRTVETAQNVAKIRCVFSVRSFNSTGIRITLQQELPQDDLKIYGMFPYTSGVDSAEGLIQIIDTQPIFDELESSLDNSCDDGTNMVLIIASTSDALQRRDAIRLTMGTQARSLGVAVFFALARQTNADVLLESKKHKDIILLNTVDSYDSLSAKTLELIQWVWHNCNRSRFLMKTDDDSYVQLTILVEKLSKMRDRYLYMGHIFENQEVYHDPQEKNFEPYYNGKIYPPYASGSGYILSMSLVRHIATMRDRQPESPPWKLIRNEDAAVGLWLAGLNISQVHDDSFWPEPPAICLSNAILVHRQPVESFFKYHSNFLESGDICLR